MLTYHWTIVFTREILARRILRFRRTDKSSQSGSIFSPPSPSSLSLPRARRFLHKFAWYYGVHAQPRGIAFIEFYVIPRQASDSGQERSRIEFPPRWNNSGVRGFDRPSIAMGTTDSYDARKRVASVSLETGTDQQKNNKTQEKKEGKRKSWNVGGGNG